MSILTDIRTQGVTPVLEDGRLKLTAAEAITPLLIGMAREHRAEIIDALETERITALDAKRHATDRARRRGYDYDSTAPSHTEYIRRQRENNEHTK